MRLLEKSATWHGGRLVYIARVELSQAESDDLDAKAAVDAAPETTIATPAAPAVEELTPVELESEAESERHKPRAHSPKGHKP